LGVVLRGDTGGGRAQKGDGGVRGAKERASGVLQ
jgi:hypothetical protein